MKTWKKVVLALLALLLLLGVGLCVWQWDNIQAAYAALTREPEEIAENLDTVRKDYQQTIRQETAVEFTPPSLEQSEALISGQQKPEEVKEALGIPQTLEPKPAPAEKLPTAQELLDQCVAELTSCQIDLMALLGEMKQAALDQWIALTPEERTLTKKKEIILAGLDECYALEAVVDDQVREILERYRRELTRIGAELSPLDTLWDYYEDEKAAQKAYYLNKYLD